MNTATDEGKYPARKLLRRAIIIWAQFIIAGGIGGAVVAILLKALAPAYEGSAYTFQGLMLSGLRYGGTIGLVVVLFAIVVFCLRNLLLGDASQKKKKRGVGAEAISDSPDGDFQ